MFLKKTIFLIMAFSLVWMAASPAGGVLAQSNGPSSTLATINSTYASTPPVLDGSLNFGEWNYANKLALTHGFLSVVNDNNRLYVLLDVTGETTDDSSDYFYVSFDTNRNGLIDPGTLAPGPDINYGLVARNMRYQHYLGPNSWTGVTANTYSARAAGFGCFWADGTFSFTFIPFHVTCAQHRVWEFGFDLAEIGAFAGSSAKMGVLVSAIRNTLHDELPPGFTADFTNLITVNLAPPPFFTMAPLQGAQVAFQSNPNAIEITQAVQKLDDSLPLVANKDTMARVYTFTGNVPIGENARTYLYGNVGGADLPGSPMVVSQRAPTVINRLNLNDTANFLLPKTWAAAGTVNFSTQAIGQNADHAASATYPLAFNTRGALTVWIVPVNTGTVGSPVLPPQSEIDRQESYMRTVYPLANLTFVQKNWNVLGVVTGEPITALNTYYNNVVFAWLFSVIFTGTPPYTLPDQIYGFTPSGGGLSDPKWAGGGGHVGRGFQGTSMEGTMAHEINHNLDTSVPGTWGRHVNPGGTGCGAAGPDPSWPYLDPFTHTVGFDTRLPWTVSGALDTVIPGTFPDFMSYCQSGLSPTKWISDYRWNALYNKFPNLAALVPLASNYPDHYYIMGNVTQDPKTSVLSGKLNPAIVQPGSDDFPVPNPKTDNFEINIYGGAQAGLLKTYPFTATFIPDPEEPVNTVYFNFSLPYIQGVTGGPEIITKIELAPYAPIGLAPTAALDTINVAPIVPTVGITNPTTAGATLNGAQTLTWTPSNTASGDTFTVMFSSDAGANWITLAANLSGVTTLAVDTTTLPNTIQGMFRVIGTDGFNTFEAKSVLITIANANTKPTVHITAPLPSHSVSSDGSVLLQGEGNDATDGVLPDDNLSWSEGNVPLGNGASIVANLADGPHTITLTGINLRGDSATTTVNVTVIHNPVYLPVVNNK
jgi:hypothetical protein